jgi:hypothetical protein
MRNSQLQQCIENCQECHTICLETLQYCAQKGGRHVEAEHLKLLSDCVQICQTSADFMIRESSLHSETCDACAAVCEACAEDCERMSDDPQMKKCADICSRCAESCHETAAMSA